MSVNHHWRQNSENLYHPIRLIYVLVILIHIQLIHIDTLSLIQYTMIKINERKGDICEV
jgi:hypothetical protein